MKESSPSTCFPATARHMPASRATASQAPARVARDRMMTARLSVLTVGLQYSCVGTDIS